MVTRRARAVACTAGALVVFMASVAAAQVAGGASPEFSFARSAAALVVRYHVVPGELAGGEGLTLEIYGDGRVVTHHPEAYRRAGTHELRLPPAELDRLMQSVVSAGVVDFDPAAVGAAKKQADEAVRAQAAAGDRPTVFSNSDPDTIELEVKLERYRPAGARQAERRDVVKSIRWTNLQGDKRQHPDNAALQGLAAADQELRGLMDRSGFAKVD